MDSLSIIPTTSSNKNRSTMKEKGLTSASWTQALQHHLQQQKQINNEREETHVC